VRSVFKALREIQRCSWDRQALRVPPVSSDTTVTKDTRVRKECRASKVSTELQLRIRHLAPQEFKDIPGPPEVTRVRKVPKEIKVLRVFKGPQDHGVSSEAQDLPIKDIKEHRELRAHLVPLAIKATREPLALLAVWGSRVTSAPLESLARGGLNLPPKVQEEHKVRQV